jgi:hypothetical protein
MGGLVLGVINIAIVVATFGPLGGAHYGFQR